MTAPLRLRVVTFNIHGGRNRRGSLDLNGTARVLAGEAADLIALQEVHRLLPPPCVFQDQPRLLSRALGLHRAFRPSVGTRVSGYGNMVLSRWPAARVRRIPLPGSGEPRALLEARFWIGGHEVRLLNAHLGLSPADRLRQAEVVAAVAAAEPIPTIAAGDWNGEPGSPEIACIEAAGLRHCAPPGTRTYPSPEPERWIDYLMASRHFETDACRTVPTEASDHCPLSAVLRLAIPRRSGPEVL